MLLDSVSYDSDVSLLQTGIRHLRGHSPLPDQTVEPLLSGSPLNLRICNISGTDSLVSLLRSLHLGLILAGLVILCSHIIRNPRLSSTYRLLRQCGGVGTHVSNQS